MKMKKIGASILSVVCAMSTLAAAGCGGGTGGGKNGTLTITVANLGFGTAWLDEIAEEFEKAYDVTVDVHPTVVQNDLLAQLESGYQLDDICMFGSNNVWDTIRLNKIAQIDDVWSYTNEGETVAIADKTLAEYKEAYKFNDHYYSLPFITEVTGLLGYNKTTLDSLFGSGNWTLPKTTAELDALCERIKDAGAYAFTWSNKENSCYWEGVVETWTAQYDTAEAYTKSNFAEIYDETESKWVLDQNGTLLERKGRLRAFEAAYPYINKNKGYSHQYSTSMTFVESQAAFAGVPYANDPKKVVFTPTGSWLYEESQEDFEYKLQEIGAMKAPVVSSLVEKMSFYTDGNTAYADLTPEKKTGYDTILSAMIAYVDGDTTSKPVGATDADIEIARQARGVVFMKDQAHAFIPSNAKNIDLAKSFLKFFCSDYAGEVYSTTTHGYSPFYIKETDGNASFLNGFDKDVLNTIETKTSVISYDSRIGFYYSRPAVENNFFTSGAHGTPDSLYEYYVETNQRTWKDALRVANLLLQ